ncbi:MAG: FKBP-type peptidyl-prolyl cis-trans isomerase [Chloroflexota bacterium]|nr:FKBP-type peptidyl-prolyl cis-trans isomerase [Ardenticatenaceae bacterium]
MKRSSGLEYIELKAGTGATPKKGDKVAVHYTGKLENGRIFDSSYDRGQPIEFVLGTGRVIRGWDEGIALMQEGGKARLIIPPHLGYGERGAGAVIPPNATLIFEVELVNATTQAAAGGPAAVAAVDYKTTKSGLKYYDLVVGNGRSPRPQQMVAVHYTGWLENGEKFDSSRDRGQPFQFTLGAGQVIRGWDEGVADMQIGGKRQLVIPPNLAYGSRGASGVIPPNATLIFEVELIAAR